jgi:hypothetical protein
MAHRLIPLTPPFFFHFTLPLKNETRMISQPAKNFVVFLANPKPVVPLDRTQQR